MSVYVGDFVVSVMTITCHTDVINKHLIKGKKRWFLVFQMSCVDDGTPGFPVLQAIQTNDRVSQVV